MPRLVGVRQVWTFLGLVALAVLALLGAPLVADALLGQTATTARRLASVIVGGSAVAPLVVCLVWLYRRSDEFERQRMLLQWSGALAGDLMLGTLQERLVLAGWLRWEHALPHLALAMIAWGLAVLLVSRRDRAPQ